MIRILWPFFILLAGCVAMVILFVQSTRVRVTRYIKPIADSILTLDPSLTRTEGAFMVSRAIFGSLLELNTFGGVEAGVFESWHMGSDGMEYEFKIREGVRFHSGKTLNADDILFTFHYLSRSESLMRFPLKSAHSVKLDCII